MDTVDSSTGSVIARRKRKLFDTKPSDMEAVVRVSRDWRNLALAAVSVAFVSAFVAESAQAQVAVGLDLAAPIAPLNQITVPDVNILGLLDKTGPGASNPAWPQITEVGNQFALQQLGKALFWDMQVGGDGIQACASCHYHAGADNRFVNQSSPGLKRTEGGQDLPAADPDFVHDLLSTNAMLTPGNFTALNQNAIEVGLPVSEAAIAAAPAGTGDWTPDAPDGAPGTIGSKAASAVDVNDVISSQGVRFGSFHSVTVPPNRVDTATLASSDDGFNHDFTLNAPGVPDTVRRVEPRNSPTVINAVYNLRNFWDGRADGFFNGVNPLGFRDPAAMVKVSLDGSDLTEEKLRIPFSSLASQAVGPIGSDFEMVFAGRPTADLGKKLLATDVVPLAGQTVSDTDSLLGLIRNASGKGLDTTYGALIEQIFDDRFWNGPNVCTDAAGGEVACTDASVVNTYTLKEWNFALFFGLAVQAYEATLTTEQTIVDLLVGGVATGQVVNATTGRRNNAQVIVPVTGLPLNGCIAAAALNNSAAQNAVATALCTQHYAQYIHPFAAAGSGANDATAGVVGAGDSIGGCETPAAETTALNGTVQTAWCGTGDITQVQAAVLAIDRGMGRFFAGATGCSICHFNPEFTGATVSALTGFGAAPPPPLPPGQARRIVPEVPMERMIAFNGAAAVYDSGFYNLGIRPTPEDLSIGDQIGGVPLAFTKLAELIEAGTAPAPYDQGKIDAIAAELAIGADGLNGLLIPTSPADLTPRPFTLALACGPGLVGNGGANGNGGLNGRAARDAGGANNNVNAQCVPTVIPGERLLRNGAFKAQGLRNVKYTGPYFHNGAKMSLRQVVETYKTAGHFSNLNLNNLDAGMRIFNLGVPDEGALVEFLETGLTDWRLAYEQDKFDHPELCVPHGHDGATGKTILRGIPAVGHLGNGVPLETFEDQLNDFDGAHALNDECTVTGIVVGGLSTIDVPSAPAP